MGNGTGHACDFRDRGTRRVQAVDGGRQDTRQGQGAGEKIVQCGRVADGGVECAAAVAGDGTCAVGDAGKEKALEGLCEFCEDEGGQG